MRALPLTNKTRGGGRPRRSRAPRNPFADWLDTCDQKPEEIAERLAKLAGREVSVSAIYNARNGYFRPGRDLAAAIEELTRDAKTGESAVPVSVWRTVKQRKRPERAA